MLEDRLVVLGALSDELEDQLVWIDRVRRGLDEAPEPGTTVTVLLQEIYDVKVNNV